MNTKDITLTQTQLYKLLASGNGDAALLFLFRQGGNDPCQAGEALSFTPARLNQAMATLRQLGLWQDQPTRCPLPQQLPQYTEQDVMNALSRTEDFPCLTGEVQRVLGRILTTEELKILLTIRNYLGFPGEVIHLLVSYCKERQLRRGNNRNPSLRTIEKEAYLWWEKGVETLEDAVAYIQAENTRHTQLASLTRLLQISGRNLTPAEERYALNWLSMGFDREALQIAYEKTCLNTGGLKWAYMDKILASWHRQGLHTGAQIRTGDRPAPAAASGAARQATQQTQRVQAGSAGLGEYEREAIARMLREREQQNKED